MINLMIIPALLIMTLHQAALGRPQGTTDEEDYGKYLFSAMDKDGDLGGDSIDKNLSPKIGSKSGPRC